MNHPIPSKSLLDDSSLLRPILAKAQQLTEIERLLAKHLPANLQPHCHVANLEAGTLTIHVNNAHWAMSLRYLLPELLEKLRGEPRLVGLATIQYKISPKGAAPKDPAPKQALRTERSLLRETAACIENAQMAETLRHLADDKDR